MDDRFYVWRMLAYVRPFQTTYIFRELRLGLVPKFCTFEFCMKSENISRDAHRIRFLVVYFLSPLAQINKQTNSKHNAQ